MDDESRIGALREELGYKAAKKGEKPHDSASNEFLKGYGFGGSNVMPSKFGKSSEIETWICQCGHINRSDRRHLIGGEEVCWNCTVRREYSENKDLDE